MPGQATVRIFNLSGQLVRTLKKTDETSSIVEWDLENENRLPVASGVYVFHIEVPGAGDETRYWGPPFARDAHGSPNLLDMLARLFTRFTQSS